MRQPIILLFSISFTSGSIWNDERDGCNHFFVDGNNNNCDFENDDEADVDGDEDEKLG